MQLAPIVLFTYNRPHHTQLTVEALQRNVLASESDLFVYLDGPKNVKDEVRVRKVKNYIEAVKGFKSVTLVNRDRNYGLSRSIISGVTEIVQRFGRVIVLEDDMVSSPYFLKFMNDGLEYYQDDDRVASVHGYTFPVKTRLPEMFFLRGADCWGWGTWKRAWDLFELDGAKLLRELSRRKLGKRFDRDGSYNNVQMLKDQIAGKNDSWAIRWRAATFLQNKLTLFSGESLIRNIGTDGSGVHSGVSTVFNSEIMDRPVLFHPIVVEEHWQASQVINRYFMSMRPGLIKGILSNSRDYLRQNKRAAIDKFRRLFLKVSRKIYFSIYADCKPISLGGWCGPGISIRSDLQIYPEAYPFDQIRSSFEGVCLCLKNDFKDFFPEQPWTLETIGIYKAYRGKYASFFHTPEHDIANPEVRRTFQRRIERLETLLRTTKKTIIFIRVVTDEDPLREFSQIPLFKEIIREKYPELRYRFVFIVHGQGVGTRQVRPIDSSVAVWCVGEVGDVFPDYTGKAYEKIIKYVVNRKNWPPRGDIVLDGFKKGNELWYVDGIPMLRQNFLEKAK